MRLNINLISYIGVKMKRFALLAVISICFLLGAAIAWLIHAPHISRPLIQQNAEVKIGGSFSLVNHKGEKVTDKNYQGKLKLVYFCYTRSTDICPAGMQTISAVLERIQKTDRKIAALLITYEPEYDTPERLASYLSAYHPQITGLTGTGDRITDAIKRFKVHYSRKPAPPGSKSSYIVSHSTYMYLMDANGKYLEHFYHGTPVERIEETILKYL